MRILTITPTYNSKNKSDATGAFIPEALEYRACMSALYPAAEIFAVKFDNSQKVKAKRRTEVEKLIWETGGDGLWDVIAFFGHGLKEAIQSGHDLKTAGDLAEVIALRSSDTVVIPLYACDAADTKVKSAPGGDGGMADTLRDILSSKNKLGHIDAHVTTGHTTINPNVRRFSKDGRGPLTGGHYIVEPKPAKDATEAQRAAVSKLWSRWRRALSDTDLRFRFPLMTQAEIHAELLA